MGVLVFHFLLIFADASSSILYNFGTLSSQESPPLFSINYAIKAPVFDVVAANTLIKLEEL